MSTAPSQPTGLIAMRTPLGAVIWWSNSWEPLQGWLLEVRMGDGAFCEMNSAPRLQRSFMYRCAPRTPQTTVLAFRVRAVDVGGNMSPWQETVAN